MSWNFMDPQSRDNIRTVWQRESEDMFELASDPAVWEAPTGAGHWQVRDIIGHIVDTTEAYFSAFDAARGNGEAPGPLGVRDMSKHVDAGAQEFRAAPQAEMLDRLRRDRDRMLEIADDLTDEDWAGLMAPHKYMGPIPACFYPIFQVVDYGIHSWDIREGSGRNHGLRADAADLLVPICFVVWQGTCDVSAVGEPYTIGIRINSGENAGDTRATVSGEGIAFEQAPVDGLAEWIDFDPASFVLTAYGRTNAGTHHGDHEILDDFCNLFFRI